MGKVFLARGALVSIGVFFATLAGATAVPAADIVSEWPGISTPSCHSQPAPRTSVVRKPRPIVPSRPTDIFSDWLGITAPNCRSQPSPRPGVVPKPRPVAPPYAPCPMPGASCPDFNQFVEQMKSIQINIDNTSSKVTNIDKSVQDFKIGFDSLLKFNASLPEIKAGLTLIQNNVALLSSIEAKLKNIESGVVSTSSGVTTINKNLEVLSNIRLGFDSLLKFNASLPEIKAGLTLIQNNVALLSSIDAKLKNIESVSVSSSVRILPDIQKALDDIQSTLSRIEINTRGPGRPLPPISPKDPWTDLDADWRHWWKQPLSGVGPANFVPAVYNKVVDGLHLAARSIYGASTDFGTRPANSLVIAVVLGGLLWLGMRYLFGKVAYLYVPAKRIKNARTVPLSMFKEYGNQWRIITPAVIARMMIPHAIDGLFSSNTFDWTKHRVIGFRLATRLNTDEFARNPPGHTQPMPSFWNRLSPSEAATRVKLPRWSYIPPTKRSKRLGGKPTAVSSKSTLETYLPGLLKTPKHGELLLFLWLSSLVGYVVAAALVSGIVAALKLWFG
jgi:hypothetical protein